MKYLITKTQYKIICEQPDQVMDRKVQGMKSIWEDTLGISFANFCRSNEDLCYFGTMTALWFIPIVGPYLSASLGAVQGIDLLRKGQTAEGVFSLMTSPLALGRIIKVLKITKSVDIDVISKLENLNKTGIPLYVSEGKTAFLIWLHKTYGRELNNQISASILLGAKLEICNLIKALQTKNPELLSKLSDEQIKEINKNCELTNKFFKPLP